MKRETEQTIKNSAVFRCPNCGWTPSAGRKDSERPMNKEYQECPTDPGPEEILTHCPNCLAGIHGRNFADRSGGTSEEEEECGGILEPVGIWVRGESEWEIIQRCSFCGEMTTTPLSHKDNLIKVLSVASKPLSSPPFPIERLEELTKIMGGRGEIGGDSNEQRK